MITIVAPAKTMNYQPILIANVLSTPHKFVKETQELVSLLQNITLEEIMSLMNVSEDIAQRTYCYFSQFNYTFQIKQAIFAYDGTVYQQLSRDFYSIDNQKFANDHVRIISGLYGLLNPFDMIKPYRLEMSTKLLNSKGNYLYSFWCDIVTNQLNCEFIDENSKVLINLASKEYFSVLDRKKFQFQIINVEFKEYRGNAFKIIGTTAKKLRGMMLDFIIKNHIDIPGELKYFKACGYNYNQDLSDDNNFIFTLR